MILVIQSMQQQYNRQIIFSRGKWLQQRKNRDVQIMLLYIDRISNDIRPDVHYVPQNYTVGCTQCKTVRWQLIDALRATAKLTDC